MFLTEFTSPYGIILIWRPTDIYSYLAFTTGRFCHTSNDRQQSVKVEIFFESHNSVFRDTTWCILLYIDWQFTETHLPSSSAHANYSALKMGAERSSETLVNAYKAIWCHTPEENIVDSNRRTNLWYNLTDGHTSVGRTEWIQWRSLCTQMCLNDVIPLWTDSIYSLY